MQPTITKEQLLDLIRGRRSAFESSMIDLPEDDYLLPGVAGHLSVKDILAHVTWWELQTVRKLNGESSPTAPTDDDSSDAVDRVNDAIYTEHRDQPLAAIRAASGASFQHLVESLSGFTEEHLRDNLAGIAADTYAHYDEHTADILKWRGKVRVQK